MIFVFCLVLFLIIWVAVAELGESDDENDKIFAFVIKLVFMIIFSVVAIGIFIAKFPFHEAFVFLTSNKFISSACSSVLGTCYLALAILAPNTESKTFKRIAWIVVTIAGSYMFTEANKIEAHAAKQSIGPYLFVILILIFLRIFYYFCNKEEKSHD